LFFEPSAAYIFITIYGKDGYTRPAFPKSALSFENVEKGSGAVSGFERHSAAKAPLVFAQVI